MTDILKVGNRQFLLQKNNNKKLIRRQKKLLHKLLLGLVGLLSALKGRIRVKINKILLKWIYKFKITVK